jgi:hypothetical protein
LAAVRRRPFESVATPLTTLHRNFRTFRLQSVDWNRLTFAAATSST